MNPDLATRVGMLGPTVIYRHWRSDDAALWQAALDAADDRIAALSPRLAELDRCVRVFVR